MPRIINDEYTHLYQLRIIKNEYKIYIDQKLVREGYFYNDRCIYVNKINFQKRKNLKNVNKCGFMKEIHHIGIEFWTKNKKSELSNILILNDIKRIKNNEREMKANNENKNDLNNNVEIKNKNEIFEKMNKKINEIKKEIKKDDDIIKLSLRNYQEKLSFEKFENIKDFNYKMYTLITKFEDSLRLISYLIIIISLMYVFFDKLSNISEAPEVIETNEIIEIKKHDLFNIRQEDVEIKKKIFELIDIAKNSFEKNKTNDKKSVQEKEFVLLSSDYLIDLLYKSPRVLLFITPIITAYISIPYYSFMNGIKNFFLDNFDFDIFLISTVIYFYKKRISI